MRISPVVCKNSSGKSNLISCLFKAYTVGLPLCGKPTDFLVSTGGGEGVRENLEWGLERERARATRFTRWRSCILCAPAGTLPIRNRLLRNLSVALLCGCARACSVHPHNKTTGHLRGRLQTGGEDKIRTCGRVTPTAV